MQQLLYYLKKIRVFLLFLLLEIIALILTVQYHSYQQSKFLNSANSITGNIYKKTNTVHEFFNLIPENQRLIEENIQLKNLLQATTVLPKDSTVNDTVYHQNYLYTYAKVVNNNYSKKNNYLTIEKGKSQGIEPDLGVINSRGIIGVVSNVSDNYATILSILNSNSKINVRLKKSSHFGTLVWNGKSYETVQLIDLPRQAQIIVGDTIITGGKSVLFPEGIQIGTIKDFTFENNQYKQINVNLFNDMSSIDYVQIVKNLKRTEQLNLEKTTSNE